MQESGGRELPTTTTASIWGPTTQKGLCWFFVRSSLALDGNIVGSDRKVSFKLSVSMYIQTCVDYVQF